MDMSPGNKRQILRKQLWNVLQEGRGRTGQAFNFLLIILILISVAIIPLEFLPSYQEFDAIIMIIESIVIACFTLEYVLRLYAAPHKIQYIFSFFGIIDLLSIVPFYSGLFGEEYIRILRLIRLFKLAEIDAAAENSDEFAMQREIGLMPGEEVRHIISKNPIALFLGVIPTTVSLIFAFGILFIFQINPISLAASVSLFLFALILLWKTWLDFSYDVIYLTNYRLIFQNQHILGRSVNQVNYNAITNVKPHYPNIFSYIFRFGSIVIDTAAEHPGQISLHTVRNHEKAAHIIMQQTFMAQKGVSPRQEMTADTATD